MLTYITNISSRPEQLFANALSKEYGSNTLIFEPDNIYEIILASKPDFVILHEGDLSNYHIKKFMKNIDDSIKTIFMVLTFSEKKYSFSSKRTNYISKDSYLPYNEYFQTELKDKNYILCDLTCKDEQKNTILQPIIYPQNKEIPVKLVNCYKVGHVQNLGLVDEQTMMKLLSGCSLYINMDNTYVYDAMNMNKPILNLTKNTLLDTVETPSLDDIKNPSVNYEASQINKNKISNLVKYIKSKYE
jgi:hypothetical protein